MGNATRRSILAAAALACLFPAYADVFSTLFSTPGSSAVSASGSSPAADGASADPQAKDGSASWTLAVAAIDASALPADEKLSGALAARSLMKALFAVPRHRYSDAERDAYARRLASEAADAALKNLQAKRGARDAVFFMGLDEAKRRSETAKADEGVKAALDAFLGARSAELPIVEEEKPLAAAKENDDGALPAPPAPADLRSTCIAKKWDALVLGKAEAYYGRLVVTVRVYSPNLAGPIYEDRVAFSKARRDEALKELAARTAAAVSGMEQARLTVRSAESGADIYVNGTLAGRGSLEGKELPPGTVKLEVDAKGREGLSESFELKSGELLTVDLDLPRLPATPLFLSAFGPDGAPVEASVRLGGLYLGKTPLRLDLPADKTLYFGADAPGNLEGGLAVVGRDRPVSASLALEFKGDPGAAPVETSRRAFYGAFGRFSVALPLAFLATGLATSYRNAAIIYNDARLGDITVRTEYAAGTLWTLTGLFAVESIWRFTRYLRASNAHAVKREG